MVNNRTHIPMSMSKFFAIGVMLSISLLSACTNQADSNASPGSDSCEIYVPLNMSSQPQAPRITSVSMDQGIEGYEIAADGMTITQVFGDQAKSVVGDDVFEYGQEISNENVNSAWLVPVGDWGVGSVQVRFINEGCNHVIWLESGTPEAAAIEFAQGM